MPLTERAILAGLPNLLENGTALTGQGAGEAFAGTHTDPRPAYPTSITTRTPAASTFQGIGAARGDVDYVEIVNHNLDRRRGSYWRAWLQLSSVGGYSTFNGLEELYPTATEASSNCTGDHTDVDDDPWQTSVDGLVATAPGAWSARFSFATPSEPLSTVGNDHLFVLRAGVTAIPATSTLTVKLYEAGNPVATLLNAEHVGYLDELGRAIFIAPWSTSQLATPSGADVEIQVESNNLLTVTSILWVAGLSLGADETGWVPVSTPPASAAFGAANAALAGEEPTQSDFALFDSPVTFAVGELPRCAVSFANASHLVEANKLGVLVAAKAFQPNYDVASFAWHVEDPSPKEKTIGGQDVGSNRRRRRVFRFALEDLTNEQMIELAQRVDWRRGHLGPFSVRLFPKHSTLKDLLGGWVTLREISPWEGYNAIDGQDVTSAIRWRREYIVEEML